MIISLQNRRLNGRNRSHSPTGFILLSIALVTTACSPEPSTSGQTDGQPRPNPYAEVITPAERLRLTNIYCAACHNVGKRDHDQLLAPPLVAIRQRYQRSFPEREAFIDRIILFTHNPTSENTLMRGPVHRFGVMPPMPHIPEKELREIAIHIFEGDLEIPDWWETHREEMLGQRGPHRYEAPR